MNTENYEQDLNQEEIHKKIIRAKKILLENKTSNNLQTSKLKVLYNNLKNLQGILKSSKKKYKDNIDNNNFDEIYNEIKNNLDEPECRETVRLDKINDSIICPYCNSENINQIVNSEENSVFSYRCLDCEKEFNDNTETPFEDEIPTIQTWMEVWYLFNCINSISYISAKLHLDPSIIQEMIRQLQKVFGEKQPLAKLEDSFEKWEKKYSFLEKSIKENIIAKGNVLLGKAVTDSEKEKSDTSEFRRQKNRSKNINKPKF